MRSSARTLVLAIAVLALGATTALAQDQEYAQLFDEARETARAASQVEDTDWQQAAEGYTESYQLAARAAELAEDEGQIGHADQIAEFGARLAYRAGKLYFDHDQIQESISHFEFGDNLDPGYAANRQGLQVAQQALARGPVVEASQALAQGNAQEALNILEDAEENGNVFFFRAEAHMELGNYTQAVTNADQALAEGGLASDRVARLHLIRGEAHMAEGNTEQARQALQQAANQGPPNVRDRAQALLDRL